MSQWNDGPILNVRWCVVTAPPSLADLVRVQRERDRLRAFEITPREARIIERAYWDGEPDALHGVEPILRRIVDAALSPTQTQQNPSGGVS